MTTKLQSVLLITLFSIIERSILKLVHDIKNKLNKGLICMPFIRSVDQLANLFTKGLGSKVFHPICCKLGMQDIFAPTYEGMLSVKDVQCPIEQ